MSGNVPPLHLCVYRDNFHFPYVTLQFNIVSFESHEYSQQTQTLFLQDPVPYNPPSVSKSSKWSHCFRFSIKTLYTFIFLTPISLYHYCCTVHLVDSLNITQPTNALIVCHLF